ncbi:hypothetical protein G3480_07895 [Thiorhodococcus mannitoliphagus]|uniref:Uncharacterized protein n=1 Tax=Thiorhodococcus mannitoliphagus TaxID=329406 RepID=A0A6P1DX61_9GAMM|nr:hypothetical protein [Thiorhodococcus mannitoliphagus]NEX20235.1 hypothetical protein [Thiorhodococcus mannitoliphagus]
MLLDNYEKEERFWLKSVLGATSTDGQYAFRGEFVVLEGELKASAGKRAPPKAMIKQAVILTEADKLRMVAGNFESVDELPEFVARFKDDLAENCVLIFYIDNLAESCQVEIEGSNYVLIEFREGMVWNELIDAFYVEKADLKGMSGEDKVAVLCEASKDYKPSFPTKTLDEVLASKTDAKREVWGAV